MANPEEAKEKGKEGGSAEVGPILKRAARLPEGKVKTGIAKAAVTTELVKGVLNTDASIGSEGSGQPRERLIDDGSAADPRLGFVERRQAEAAHTDEIIERIKGAPTATDEISMHEQVFMGAPGAAANVERHLSGRALSGNMVPSIPLPPVRVGESELSLPVTTTEIAAGKIRVAPDSHSLESGEVQERTIIPGPDGPTAV